MASRLASRLPGWNVTTATDRVGSELVQVFTPSAQVQTEIKAQNNCNRDIQPTDLMFEISGWRNGGLIQSVRGMPFDRIRRRHSGIISIGLPGSLDWYDEITVVVVEIRGDKVRLGVEAPKEVPVHRQEIHEAIKKAAS